MSFIKLDRKILKWEWFTDGNMTKVWIYILCKANIKDNYYKGDLIPRGSLVTSINTIAEECGLSIRNVRTCLERMKKTGEISIKSTNKYTVINALKYDDYNKRGSYNDKQLTNKRQSNGKQLTTLEEIKNIRSKEINKYDDDTTNILSRFREAGYNEDFILDCIKIADKFRIDKTESFSKVVEIMEKDDIRDKEAYLYTMFILNKEGVENESKNFQ